MLGLPLNFKLILFLIVLCGCGVKGNPVAPKSSKLPSLLENYPDTKIDKPLDEFKKQRR